MAGIVPVLAFFLADAISNSEKEEDVNRRERVRELSRSVGDISERVREKYEMIQGLLPKDEATLVIWTRAVSEKSWKSITQTIGGFTNIVFPAMDGSKIDIPELHYMRFFMRKLELQLQAMLKSVKEMLLAVSTLTSALSTYDDLASSGTISASQAAEAKARVLAQHPGVDIEMPEGPSNLKIFEELRERDHASKVYTDEDPSLELTEKWLATI